MDISKHIRNYLSEKSSVIVPGLGRFTAVDKPSEIQGDVVIPPTRTIVYDSSQDEDDGVLSAYIAEQENQDISQVKADLATFYDNLKNKLANKKAILLNNFGTISANSLGDIIFEPEANLFIERTESYGLDSVNLQGKVSGPVITPPQEPTASIPKPPVAEPVVSAVKPPIPPIPPIEPATPEQAPKDTQAEPLKAEGSIFATENMRVRENTERRRPSAERQEPPIKPVRPAAKTPPPSQKKKPENRKKTTKAGNSFPMWILLVLLIAAALGIGSYFLYPKLSPYIDSSISSIFRNKETVPPASQPPIASSDGEDTPNPEVAQTLDEATEKKNALNPATETPAQTEPAAREPKPQVTEIKQPVSQPRTTTNQPATASVQQGNIGQGKYLLIVGSFTTQARAEKFGKSLKDAGVNYEIIDFGNQKVRVAVAGYNDKTEAFNQVNNFKTKPHCENAWVLRR